MSKTNLSPRTEIMRMLAGVETPVLQEILAVLRLHRSGVELFQALERVTGAREVPATWPSFTAGGWA